MPTHATGRRWIVPVAAGTLALIGYFGPWVGHKAAGLVITGIDLAEYVKFLPEVISGQILLQREAFYAPLAAGSLIATLLASRSRLGSFWRGILILAAVVLALAQLPPAWSPDTLQAPEFRVQIVAIFLCLATVPLIVLIRYLPDRIVLAGLSLLALFASIWPAWSFLQVHPAIAVVYNTPLPLGWGFWVCSFGWAGLMFLGLAFALQRR